MAGEVMVPDDTKLGFGGGGDGTGLQTELSNMMKMGLIRF